jgi:hypothetical protein
VEFISTNISRFPRGLAMTSMANYFVVHQKVIFMGENMKFTIKNQQKFGIE